MKLCKRIFSILFCVLLLSSTVLAAGSIDCSTTGQLTISAVYDTTPLSGMLFSLYHVSTVDESGELTPTERFSFHAEALDIRGKNDAAWTKLANTLEQKIVLSNSIRPDFSAVCGTDGTVCFENLPLGLYLVTSSNLELNGYVYSVDPFFVLLPTQNAASNTWNYAVSVNAKAVQYPVRMDYEVLKIWKDECHENQHPESIEIVLWQDGKEFDRITLPENGHWSHTWSGLDVHHKWMVTETQQPGYAQPDITREGQTFVVTNTCIKSEAPTSSDLPQTGQLWWPVPVLLCAGLLFVLIGLMRRRGSSHET